MNQYHKATNKNSRRQTVVNQLEKIFFALFLLSAPLQTRLSFPSAQTFSNGTFNEYTTYFLYLSDIFFIITFLLYFVNYFNLLTKYSFFSIIKNIIHTYPRLIPICISLITLITWSFIDILGANYKYIAFYQALKLLQFGALFLYVTFRLSWFNLVQLTTLIFISGFLESLIGIGQYLLQRSIGLKILMEPLLSPEMPNVAKIVVDGEKILRAYSTFPHPNVFAGFLILSISCGFYLLIIDKLNIITRVSAKTRQGKTILYIFLIVGIIFEITALTLTFSRSAWLAGLISILIYVFLTLSQKLFHVKQFYKNVGWAKVFHSIKQIVSCLPSENNSSNTKINSNTFSKIVSRETILIPFFIIFLSTAIIIGLNWKQIDNRTSNIYHESTDNRILYNSIAIDIIKSHPIVGIGSKGFTLTMQNFSNTKLEWWQYQPAHNIYLLMASELGFIGLLLFLLFIFYILKTALINAKKQIVSRLPAEAVTARHTRNTTVNNKIVSRETILQERERSETILMKRMLVSVLFGFLFIGLFDHYFWTLQQGQLTFWLTLGIIGGMLRQSYAHSLDT